MVDVLFSNLLVVSINVVLVPLAKLNSVQNGPEATRILISSIKTQWFITGVYTISAALTMATLWVCSSVTTYAVKIRML